MTGGIGLKAARGAMISEKGVDVQIINGEHPKRVLAAIDGENVLGTKIVSGNC